MSSQGQEAPRSGRCPRRSRLRRGTAGRCGSGWTAALGTLRPEAVRGRSVVAVGELFESRGADVHRVAQGAGFRPGLGHPDQVRRDVPANVLGARVAYPREVPPVLHLGRGLDYRHAAVRLVGDLDELGVYAAGPCCELRPASPQIERIVFPDGL